MKEYLQNFKTVFEREYTWKEGFMRNVYRYGNKLALYYPEKKEKWT